MNGRSGDGTWRILEKTGDWIPKLHCCNDFSDSSSVPRSNYQMTSVQERISASGGI